MSRLNNLAVDLRLKVLEAEVKEMKGLLYQLLRGKTSESFTPDEREDRIMNVNEAIKFLKMPRHVLYSKTIAGEIPSFRVGKLYKYERSKLLEWQNAENQGNKIDVDDYVERYLQTHIYKA